MAYRIADIELSSPFVLGPMAGITDAVMRTICEEMGASLVYTEMVSAKGLYYGDRKTPLLTYIPDGAGPCAIQIFGSEPDIIGCAAAKLDSLPNVILDINMGCPVPKVVRNGDGSALMQDPDLVYRIVSAAVSNTSKPVTVKIRKGFTDDNINAPEVACAAEAGGASAVAVHGRTRPQYYSGTADWDIIGEVKRSVGIPVIGSGDVFTAGDGIRMMRETGCDLVMAARGAMGNPWLFRDMRRALEGLEPLPEPTGREKTEMMIRHLEMLCLLKGETAGVKEFRKFTVHYTKGLKGSAAVRRAANDADTFERMKEILESQNW